MTGEITVAGKIDHETVVRGVAQNIHIDSFMDDFGSVDSRGLNLQDCEGLFRVSKQSLDIAGGVHVGMDDLFWRFHPHGETSVYDDGHVDAQQPHRSKQHHSNQLQSTRQAMQRQTGERKGERGKEEEERDAEEAEHEQVKKDVTGWTLVTGSRKHRKRTVQIFVKVDGSKVTPMEVGLTDDKVEDVMRQIQKDEDVFVTMHGRVLRRSEKLRRCGLTDGCSIQVTSRMRGGGRHKDETSHETGASE